MHSVRGMVFFTLGCLAASLLACVRAGHAAEALPGLEGLPDPVAEVDGKALSREALIRELVGANGEAALDRLVRRKVIEQAAQEMGVTVTSGEIEQEFAVDKVELMADLIRPMWQWDKKYKEFPIADIIQARFRMTLDEYKQTVVRQKLLIRKCVTRDLHPTEEDLLKIFNANREYFQPPVKYDASHILVSPFNPQDLHRSMAFRSAARQMETLKDEREEVVTDSDGRRRRRIDLFRDHGIDLDNAPSVDRLGAEWERAREKAGQVLREIRAGNISWDQAVRKYSQDPMDHPTRTDNKGNKISLREAMTPPMAPGEVGWFHSRGPVVHEFYEGAKNLQPGEIGGPVQTEYGYHLIKMLKVDRPPELTFDQCRSRVERLYLDKIVQVRSYDWILELVNRAKLTNERALLWPPAPSQPTIGLAAPDAPANNSAAPAEADPVIGTVNGAPLKRSDVWRELVRSDADEALQRLVNFEIVMRLLKNEGLARLEWEVADPARRDSQPPPPHPIVISPDDIDLALNDDRLRLDAANEELRAHGKPEKSFGDYIYERYGQGVGAYRRVMEADLILRQAIRDRVPTDDKTLQLQFALAREVYDQPAWYEASQILIVPNGGMNTTDQAAQLGAQKVAQELARTYTAGADFAELARKFSMDETTKANGGKLPACHPDERSQFPDSALYYQEIKKQNLESGQVSSPLRTSRGYAIVRVDKIHPARKAEFRDVKRQVECDYLREQAKLYTGIWLRALRAPGRVKIFLMNPADEAQDTAPVHLPLPDK